MGTRSGDNRLRQDERMSEMSDLRQLFPWVVGTHDGVEMDVVIASVLSERRNVPLGTLFSTLPNALPLGSLSLGTRIANLLEARGEFHFEALAQYSTADIATWRTVGIGSLEQLVRGLATAVVIHAESDAFAIDELVGRKQAPAWIDEVVKDMTTIARWQRLRGDENTPLLGAVEHNEPTGVRAARARLFSFTAASVLPPAIESGEAAELVRSVLADLGGRETAIVLDRLVADRPMTLEELASRHSVTRERIRQLEQKVKALLSDRVREGELGALAEATRDTIGIVIPLRKLLQRFPTLAETVPELEQPVWRVLDRLDATYEIADGWCATGTIKEAISRTAAILARGSTNGRFTEVASVDADIELSDEWLKYAGVTLLQGIALLGRDSIPGRAEVILHRSQAPLSTTEIHRQLGVERSVTALKNGLSVDDRFTRVDRDDWGLRVWGLDGYEPIHALVGRSLDTVGGSISLQDLIADLTGKFHVSPKSVIAYASGFPYITARGIVRRRTRRDMRKRIGRKGLSHTKGLFRFPTDVRLRVTVTGEHLRGSGTPLPNALGEELDLSIGEVRELRTASGAVQLSRPRSQILLGSVRMEMGRLRAKEGEIVFYVFGDDGAFHIEPIPSYDDLRGGIGAQAGAVIPTSADVYEALADRIDAEIATRDGVRMVCEERGDAKLVELIDQFSREAEFSHDRSS